MTNYNYVFFRFRLWAGWDTSSGRYWHSSDARLKDWPMLSARGLPSSLQDFMLGLVFYCSWSLHCTCSILYCSTIVPYRTILTYIILIILSCSLLIYSAKTSRAFWSRQTDLDKVSTEHWSSGCLWKVQPLRCSVGVWRTGRWRQTFSYQILSVHIQCRINPCHISAYFWIYHAIIECHCNMSLQYFVAFLDASLESKPQKEHAQKFVSFRSFNPFAKVSMFSPRPFLGAYWPCSVPGTTTWHNTTALQVFLKVISLYFFDRIAQGRFNQVFLAIAFFQIGHVFGSYWDQDRDA